MYAIFLSTFGSKKGVNTCLQKNEISDNTTILKPSTTLSDDNSAMYVSRNLMPPARLKQTNCGNHPAPIAFEISIFR